MCFYEFFFGKRKKSSPYEDTIEALKLHYEAESDEDLMKILMKKKGCASPKELLTKIKETNPNQQNENAIKALRYFIQKQIKFQCAFGCVIL